MEWGRLRRLITPANLNLKLALKVANVNAVALFTQKKKHFVLLPVDSQTHVMSITDSLR